VERSVALLHVTQTQVGLSFIISVGWERKENNHYYEMNINQT